MQKKYSKINPRRFLIKFVKVRKQIPRSREIKFDEVNPFVWLMLNQDRPSILLLNSLAKASRKNTRIFPSSGRGCSPFSPKSHNFGAPSSTQSTKT